ncbi:MAG: hypothetical protein GY749_13840 [Desulfobacteraceae bacterium]|nr:hypothetical protein [Desulfobacteraceae bacterium]
MLRYLRLLPASGHSLTFTYFYLFLNSVIVSGLGIALLTALLKNRSLTASKMSLSEFSSSDSFGFRFLFFFLEHEKNEY